jgi:hypothetical protein
MPCQDTLWRALGLEADIVDRLVELQLRWDPSDRKLKVGSEHADSPTLAADILALIRCTWRFDAFTESRWIGLGPSARGLVAATMLGLEDLVQWVRSTPGESQYYISGFSHFDLRAKKFMGVVSISSYLADGVLTILFGDDRVPVVLADIDLR